MNDSEQQTCGKGLAENSALPAKIGELIAAMAENLSVHMKALYPTDQNSRMEYDAYEELTKELRQIADQLRATANQMAEYHDLPMGRHDEKAMTHSRIGTAFENFVQYKQELMELLQQTQKRDYKLLDMMRVDKG